MTKICEVMIRMQPVAVSPHGSCYNYRTLRLVSPMNPVSLSATRTH